MSEEKIPADLFSTYANNLFLIASEMEGEYDDLALQISIMREGAQEITNLQAQLKRERERCDDFVKVVKIMKFAFSTKGGRLSPTDREICEALDEAIAAILREREA